MNTNKPWEEQKKLQEKYRADEVPTLHELQTIIKNIDIGKEHKLFQTMRAQALFVIYYLTGCRISEVVKIKKLRYDRYKSTKEADERGVLRKKYVTGKEGKRIIEKGTEEHKYLGLRKSSIRFDQFEGKEVMYVRTENRKNKLKKTKHLPVPVNLEKDLVYFLKRYLKALPSDDRILFDFGTQRANQVIKMITDKDGLPFNVHFIRHIRATHLVTLYDFNEQLLIKFMGWTDGRPAKHYMELSVKDMIRQFYKNGAR